MHDRNLLKLLAINAVSLVCMAIAAHPAYAHDGPEEHSNEEWLLANRAAYDHLSQSANTGDRLAATFFTMHLDWDESQKAEAILLEELLIQEPKNGLVAYQAQKICGSSESPVFCGEYDLTQTILDADPGNGLIHLFNAGEYAPEYDQEGFWQSLRYASESRRIDQVERQFAQLIVTALKRYPELERSLTHADPWFIVPTDVLAISLTMFQLDAALSAHSAKFACAKLHDETNEPSGNTDRLETCIKLSRRLQESNDNDVREVGLHIEAELLEALGSNPERLQQLNEIFIEIENIHIAGSHANRLVNYYDNPDLLSHTYRILFLQGQTAMQRELANLAGIDWANPPPRCVTESELARRIERIQGNGQQDTLEDFPDLCPDHLVPPFVDDLQRRN